jgi:hypothetical protein
MNLRQNTLLLTEPSRIEDNHPSQRAIRSAAPVTKIVSAYSSGDQFDRRYGDLNVGWLPPCAAGFESLVRLRQDSEARGGRVFAQ